MNVNIWEDFQICISVPLIFIPSKDEIIKKYSFSDISEAQNLKRSKTGGLALLLKVKIDVRLMITTN